MFFETQKPNVELCSITSNVDFFAELLIPEKGNVFYAMNKSDGSEPVFVVRTRQDHDSRTQHRKRGRRKLKNWSL